MKINIDNFEAFNNELYDLVIVPMDNDVGGGRLEKEEIDIIKKCPNAKSLKVSGLNQETFEYLIRNYGQQFEAIFFHKNKMESDLSLLSNLDGLKYISYFFNQKATNLWDMSKNINLKGLAIYDFSRLHSIEMISTAPDLEVFSIGDQVWAGTVIESLKPLIDSTVTRFSWWGKKIEDNDFQACHKVRLKN